MAGFTSRDGIINAITTLERQETRNFFKVASASTLGGLTWQSLLAMPGSPGATSLVGSISPGVVHDSDAVSSLAGSMFFGDQSPLSRYLLSFGGVSSAVCTLMLYDRLATVSSVSIATTGSKTVSSNPLARYAGTQSTLNEAWLEVTTTGTVAGNGTMVYVDGGGTPQTTTSTWGLLAAATPVSTMIQIPLLSTAVPGVRSVSSLNVTVASTGHTVNLVILRPLARIPLGAGLWNEVSFLDDPMGLPRIYDGATLCLATIGQTLTNNIWGNFSTVYS